MEEGSLTQTAKKSRYLHLLQKLKKGKLTKAEVEEIEEHEENNEGGINHRRLNQQAVKKILHITPHTINDWVNKGCPVEHSKGKIFYDCGKILKWRISYEREICKVDGDLGAGASDSPSLERLRKAKAELAEIDLHVKKGMLIEKEYFEEYVSNLIITAKRHLEVLGKKVSVKVSRYKSAVKIQKIIDDQITIILKRMRNAKR
jgi:phage terminase Nu1 subunit (DNA packaging protein)